MATQFVKENVSTRFNSHRDKECLVRYHVIATVDGKLSELFHLSVYSGRSANATTIYVDFHNKLHRTQGNGKVSGGNFNKEGCAVDEALRNAGMVDFDSAEKSGYTRQTLQEMAFDFGFMDAIVVS